MHRVKPWKRLSLFRTLRARRHFLLLSPSRSERREKKLPESHNTPDYSESSALYSSGRLMLVRILSQSHSGKSEAVTVRSLTSGRK